MPAIYARVRPSCACYAVLIVLIPPSGSLTSFNRLLLSFRIQSCCAIRDNRSVLTAWLIPFAILEAITMAAFATWNGLA